MLVSIIIPVYNVEAYLARCLDSVIDQSYSELEIILVNDGSTDRSRKLCEAYASRDPRIKLVDQDNAGLSQARNHGIDLAQGEFLAFVDSDDYLEPNYVETLLAAFSADVQVAVASYYVSEPDSATESIAHLSPAASITGRALLERILTPEIGGFYVTAWNKLYRRDVFATARYDVGRNYEDDWLSARLFYPLEAVAIIDVPLYHYVKRRGSIMQSTLTDQKVYDYLDLCKQKRAFFVAKQDMALALATDEKLILWVVNEVLRVDTDLSAQAWQSLRRAYRHAYSPKLFVKAPRLWLLSSLGYVSLALIKLMRAAVHVGKRVSKSAT